MRVTYDIENSTPRKHQSLTSIESYSTVQIFQNYNIIMRLVAQHMYSQITTAIHTEDGAQGQDLVTTLGYLPVMKDLFI
jgi:hypothetical protein